jgi:hypothetical protein
MTDAPTPSFGAENAAGSVGAGVPWSRDVLVVARAVLPRPGLWWASLGALGRMARHGWWHRAPFLPLPGEAYWRFRLVTAYGGDGESAALTPPDVVAYLRWCQRSRPRRG